MYCPLPVGESTRPAGRPDELDPVEGLPVLGRDVVVELGRLVVVDELG